MRQESITIAQQSGTIGTDTDSDDASDRTGKRTIARRKVTESAVRWLVWRVFGDVSHVPVEHLCATRGQHEVYGVSSRLRPDEGYRDQVVLISVRLEYGAGVLGEVDSLPSHRDEARREAH